MNDFQNITVINDILLGLIVRYKGSYIFNSDMQNYDMHN